MADPVAIELKGDEALVLFEFLSDGNEHLAAALKRHPGAWSVMNTVQGNLERHLHEPFLPDYRDHLAKARDSIIERCGADPD